MDAEEFLDAPLFIEEQPNVISPIGTTEGFGAIQAIKTSKKDYRIAYRFVNITSHSQREVLHECPRHFQITKIPTNVDSSVLFLNLDFVYGHSVGAGIQTYLATRNKQQALFASFLAWNCDLDFALPKKGKSSVLAGLAIEKFIYFWEKSFGEEWELAYFNGKPSTELTFFIDCENGYFHAGHVDAILRNKRTGRYMVLEIKTTAIRTVDEAQYANSGQAVGYSIILDKIVNDLDAVSQFEVLYLVYSSEQREYTAFPFTKNRVERAEWLQDLLLDHTLINTYKKIDFFPKRGQSCWSFGKRCPHFGVCDMRSVKKTAEAFEMYDPATHPLPEAMDFKFKLSELTEGILR